MRIGFVGLGKMGSQIVAKFLGKQIEVVVYDVNADAIKAMADVGAEVAGSREDLVSKLGDNPVLWLMIPSDFVEAEIQEYSRILPPGSLVIDGV
jgi:6-phosphogluconate dehydrogenase